MTWYNGVLDAAIDVVVVITTNYDLRNAKRLVLKVDFPLSPRRRFLLLMCQSI